MTRERNKRMIDWKRKAQRERDSILEKGKREERDKKEKKIKTKEKETNRGVER